MQIRRVGEEPALADALATLLIDVVDGGASVGFMAPLARSTASAFWRGCLAATARGERRLLLAEDAGSGALLGTVQLLLAMPDNQPHRADVAKLQVHRAARGRGVGVALMQALETVAREEGRTLLVLDTASGSAAERLYLRLGWQRCGTIPGYALLPRGGLCATSIYYKQIGAAI